MDANDIAGQHDSATLAAQHMLSTMSDRPEQFLGNPWRRLQQQCQRARDGQGDGGMNYLDIPF
jgi:hypothetical protein